MNLHMMFNVLFLPVILTISSASRMLLESKPAIIQQPLTQQLQIRCTVKDETQRTNPALSRSLEKRDVPTASDSSSIASSNRSTGQTPQSEKNAKIIRTEKTIISNLHNPAPRTQSTKKPLTRSVHFSYDTTSSEPYEYSSNAAKTVLQPYEYSSYETTTTLPYEYSSYETSTTPPYEYFSKETMTTLPYEYSSYETTTTPPYEYSSYETTTTTPYEYSSYETTTTLPYEYSSYETTTTPPYEYSSYETTTTPPYAYSSDGTTTTTPYEYYSYETSTTPQDGYISPETNPATSSELYSTTETNAATSPDSYSITTETNTPPLSTTLPSWTYSPEVSISHVTSIIISKLNPNTGLRETVASVTPFDPASSEGRYQENLRVEGSSTTSPVPGELGYLQLTWDSPVADQAGTYTCEVFALNGEKHSVYLNGSIHVDATEPTVADLVKYIIIHQNLVEDLQEENRQLQHELMDLKFNITLPLYHEIMNMKQSMDEMKNTVNIHSAEISFLAENLHNLTTPVNVTTPAPLQVSPTVPVVS